MSIDKLTPLNFNEQVFNYITRKEGKENYVYSSNEDGDEHYVNSPFMIIGPMYSGKTTTLINLKEHLETLTNYKIGIFNSNIDNRYGDNCEIISHDKVVCNGISVNDGDELYEKSQDYDIILINEAQFIKNLYLCVSDLIKENKYVIVSGLDMDYKKCWFDDMWYIYYRLCKQNKSKILQRVGFCDICRNNVGQFSKKIKHNDENNVIEVGGKELYLCSCEECYDI